MEKINLFDLVSPLDYRYYGSDKKIVKELSPYFSEKAKISYQLKVEEALVQTFAKKKICSAKIAKEISNAIKKVKPEEVYKEEKKIKHDIRALVNSIRKRVSKKAKPFVHLTITSYDVVDTADALRFKHGVQKTILPELKNFQKTLIKLAKKEAKTVQVGRTHGQFASPVTFGFTIAEYVDRLGTRIEAIEKANNNLVGKVSGAVGAYNASSLILPNPLEFEKLLLKKLGLKTGGHSTQIVEKEPMLDLMHAIVSAFGVLANLADDMRHLQRSEISEIYESFGSKQVGSSTMPHKKNPISFENVKSLWKAFMPKMVTLYSDQVSEHQRDLSNSASGRFSAELFTAFFIAVKKLNKTMSNIKVDRKQMAQNFNKAADSIAAEPLYVLLAFYGHQNAHEYVRKLSLKSEKQKKSIYELALNDSKLKPFLDNFSKKQLNFIKKPETYTGKATQKTLQICKKWK